MIIGLTGTIGSGKSEISKYLQKKGFNYITISDIVREEATKANIPLIREQLQKLGNNLRKQHGNNYWAKRAIERIDLNKNWVIDGIRNPGEIEELKNISNFYLIAIDAPENIRLIRIKRRKRILDGRITSDPQKEEHLKIVEQRDRGLNEPEYGQQVLKCIEQSDFILINDGSILDLQKKIDEIFIKIKN